MEESEYNPLEEKSEVTQETTEENGSDPPWFAEIKPLPMPDPLKEEPMEPEETLFVQAVTSTKPYPCACGICKEYFPTIEELSKHVSTVHGPMSCYNCNQVYRKTDIHTCARMEITVPAAKPPIKILPMPAPVKEEGETAPGDTVKKETGGVEPTQEAKGRKKYLCKICKVAFATLEEARKHARKYRDPPVQCEHCEMVFHSAKLCATHAKKHSANFPHACDFCDQVFPTKLLLQRHAATHTKAVKDFLKHTCGDCGEIFADEGRLAAHRKMLDELHRCHYCPRGFRLNRELYKHLLGHPEFCPHKCHLCEAAFKQKCDLKRHLFEHRQKAFECDFCNRRFTQKYTLRDHQMTHAPFQCHVCSALYPLLDELQEHMREEGHEYECNVCNRGFQHKRDLRNHLLEHAEGNPPSV